MCREHAPEAIEKLLDLLRSDDNRAVAFAIQTLLDRGFGKAIQPVDVGDGSPITLLHLIAARSIADQMQAMLAAGKTNGSANGSTEPPVIDLSSPALE